MTPRLADHKDEIHDLYFEQGKPMQEIGDKYGKSREAVRQFLNRHYPDRETGREFRSRLRAEERERTATEVEEAKVKDAPPCVICGEPVTRPTGGRGSRRTCSTEHSNLWAKARFLLDPELRERQRQSIARSILKFRQHKKQNEIEWALKVVNGEPINTRTYVMPGSQARKAFDEVMRIRAEKGYNP